MRLLGAGAACCLWLAGHAQALAKRQAADGHQCTPAIPNDILHSPSVLDHPAVLQALRALDAQLAAIDNADAVSFALVHAAADKPVYTFNKGRSRLNESAGDANPPVSADSLYRVDSVTKSVVFLTGLVLERQARCQSHDHGGASAFSMAMPLRLALPAFRLPRDDWAAGGSDITLNMLASHTSGLPREGYITNFSLYSGTSRASAAYVGYEWASSTPDDVLSSVASRGLVFNPQERVSYSNAAYNMLAYAIHHVYATVSRSPAAQSWSDIAYDTVLRPLNLTRSFFGPVPAALRSGISIPFGPSWIDLALGPGYDPAAGMWSSANDLATLLQRVWLAPHPALITPLQRRAALRPAALLSDGIQGVAPGWELQTYRSAGSAYLAFGKAGDGGGQHAYIAALPALGYGLVVLASQGDNAAANTTPTAPLAVADAAHAILLPAFRTAYSALLAQRYAGRYAAPGNSSAELAVQGNALYLRSLVADGVSALRRLDMLDWAPGSSPLYYSLPAGASLHPSERGAAQTFALAVDSGGLCDYLDFDGYTDAQGWPLDHVVLADVQGGGVELRYPPLNATLVRVA